VSAVWIDGRLIEEAEARLSPFDHGLLTGDGVFETLRVYRGVPFAVGRHLDRLARSAAGLRLAAPHEGVLRAAMDAVVAANGLAEGRVRVTVTGGVAPPIPVRPATALVATVPWPRNERSALAGLKTISYAENVVALAFARERGAEEAIFANLAGDLCEGTGTNVFVGVGGRVFTPSLFSGCLPGVTRDLLVELLDVVEDEIPLPALARADEAFLTSSTRGVHPISAVDGHALPAAPGPLTRAAAEAFEALVARDLDP
jgi:branched-chain amino acid aminotransferase